MKEKIINEVIRDMSNTLDKNQISQLIAVLTKSLTNVKITPIYSTELTIKLEENELLLKSFFACKRIDGLAESSAKAYKFTLYKFLDFISFKSLLKVDTNIIRLFLLHCEENCSKSTTDNYRRNLNAFYQWLENEDYILKNPCRKIARLKEPKRIKRYFTDLEIETLRDACKNKKELALIDLLISSGLRIGEIPTIKISEIDWNEGRFTVIGKCDKQRYGYMTVRAKKHLLDYLKEREENGIYSDYLFCRSNKPYDKPIGKNAVGKIIKNIGLRCGIKDIHVHGIRAYFATNLSDKGVAPQTIQQLMGHDSYSTTVRYYCKPNNYKAKEAINTFCA